MDTGTTTYSPSLEQGKHAGDAFQHTEGRIARTIEDQTAKLPSDTFLWAAGASIVTSMCFMMAGRKDEAQFVGQWAPTFLILGLYNKLVKQLGHDQINRGY